MKCAITRTMKSFIKSHKRSDSGQSTTSGYGKSGLKTPGKSPVIPQLASDTFNLPNTFISNPSITSDSSNPNSPKKLLTPIRNLFQKRRSNDLVPTMSSLSKESYNSTILTQSNSVNKAKVRGTETLYDSDLDESVVTNTSKFSFVQDMKGGRNTSIKYYKTKTNPGQFSQKINHNEMDILQDMDIEDYDFDNNGLDDYDNDEEYENINYIDNFNEAPLPRMPMNSDNGLISHIEDFTHDDDDDDDDYDSNEDLDQQDDYYIQQYEMNEENNRRYNQAFFETESILTLPHNKVPFYKSYHLSIDGITGLESSQEFDEYGILDSYMELDDIESTNSPTKFESFDNLELYDLHSPLINGLNIGSDMSYRFRNTSPNVAKYKSRIKSFHYSIDEIDLIQSIHDSEQSEESSPENYNESEPRSEDFNFESQLENDEPTNDYIPEPPKTINRRSINEIMTLLDNLQIDNQQGQKNKRDSIENMMSFLQNIQKSQKLEISKPSQNRKQSAAFRDEPFNYQFKFQDDLTDLEKDLIDEINQLPEDFDFDLDQDLTNQLNRINLQANLFMRSNSFNKKPKKILAVNTKNNNKIETINKTVTYYSKPKLQYEVRGEKNLSTITEGNT